MGETVSIVFNVPGWALVVCALIAIIAACLQSWSAVLQFKIAKIKLQIRRMKDAAPTSKPEGE